MGSSPRLKVLSALWDLQASGEVCSGLNENGPHRLTGNSLWSRCGLVGWGWALRSQMPKPVPGSPSLPAAYGSGCKTLDYFFMSTCVPPCPATMTMV